MATRWAWVALVGSLGCSSAPEEGEAACGPRTGVYRVSSVTRSGNCGELGEDVVNFDGAELDPTCSSRYPLDLTSCKVTSEISCSVIGKAGWQTHSAGVTNWRPGGASGSELLSFSITENGELLCQGTYDVTYTKL